MSMNSEGKIVRFKHDEIPKSSPEDLARLLAIRDEDIDYSDIPSRTDRQRLIRNADGTLVPRPSPIRDAVKNAMAEREMTVYAIWKEARVYCPTISETAIGEFLKGERKIGIDYVEALLMAANLIVTRNPTVGAPHP